MSKERIIFLHFNFYLFCDGYLKWFKQLTVFAPAIQIHAFEFLSYLRFRVISLNSLLRVMGASQIAQRAGELRKLLMKICNMVEIIDYYLVWPFAAFSTASQWSSIYECFKPDWVVPPLYKIQAEKGNQTVLSLNWD